MKRDLVIAKAVADGRIPPERIRFYQDMWEKNPTQAEALIGMLTPSPLQPQIGTIEHVQRIAQGEATASAPPAGPAYDPAWLPEVKRQGPRTIEFELGTWAATQAEAMG